MFSEAALLLRETIVMGEKVFGVNHLKVLESRAMLCTNLFNSGKHEEARALHQELFPLVRRILGPSHGLTQHLARLETKVNV